MTRPDFYELPFDSRPDLTPYLIHLTKNTTKKNGRSAYDNLVRILKSGEISGSDTRVGFIKGKRPATCFMDVPFASLKYVLTPDNSARYEPYGIVISKPYGYRNGCRPVLYLSNWEVTKLKIPASELWRVVRFEVGKKGWLSWLHEREWRCPGDFELPSTLIAAFVRTTPEAEDLTTRIAKNPKKFVCRPRSVIPLAVVCQGLLT
jgi:hypothetical protein